MHISSVGGNSPQATYLRHPLQWPAELRHLQIASRPAPPYH